MGVSLTLRGGAPAVTSSRTGRAVPSDILHIYNPERQMFTLSLHSPDFLCIVRGSSNPPLALTLLSRRAVELWPNRDSYRLWDPLTFTRSAFDQDPPIFNPPLDLTDILQS